MTVTKKLKMEKMGWSIQSLNLNKILKNMAINDQGYNNSMDKRFVMRAQLEGFAWNDIVDNIEQDGVSIKVHDSIMEVSYYNESDYPKVIEIVKAYLNAYAFRNNTKLKADFNHTWEVVEGGGKKHAMGLTANLNFDARIKVSERVQVRVNQATITGKARIVTKEMHDSASFTNDSTLANKILADTTLRDALKFYADEVLDADRPLYGIYKALEVITDKLGRNGRRDLAAMVSEGKVYINDLMETTQTTRHAVTPARQRITEVECRQRAHRLIEAYAASVTL